MGHKPDGGDWVAAIQDPRDRDRYAAGVSHFQGMLSTSGDYEYAWTPDYLQNHILDPATGSSPTELASVSVATPNGALADGRSTAIMVMGVREGMRLARRTQGVEVFLVRKDGRRLHSPGFPLCVLA